MNNKTNIYIAQYSPLRKFYRKHNYYPNKKANIRLKKIYIKKIHEMLGHASFMGLNHDRNSSFMVHTME